MNVIAPASTPVLVELVEGQLTTTSLDVAAHFGKRHDIVLRAVRQLECSPEFRLRNFAEVSQEVAQPNGGVAKYPAVRMTRDGFTFLCMGFTGKEAAKWKEAYINAFNEMERALSGAAANPGAATGPSELAEPIHLTYNDRPFRIIPEGAELWFVAADVAHALDMRDAYRITRHLRSEHKSHRQVGRQRLNVIDRRGLDLALLHGPLERTEPLRLWLDAALEQYVPSAAPRALLGGLSDEQQGAIKALVSARIDALPEAQRGKAATRCWSALKSKFGCSYKEIAPEQFTEAVSLVARIVLEGELLEPEEAEAPKVIGRLPIDFPIRRWLTDNPWIAQRQQLVGPDQLVVSADMLCGMDARSPTLQLLAELEKADYNVAACRVEVLSMRHHLEMSASFFRDIRAISESAQQQGLRLRISEPGA